MVSTREGGVPVTKKARDSIRGAGDLGLRREMGKKSRQLNNPPHSKGWDTGPVRKKMGQGNDLNWG